jgi:hypothetical protein
MKLEDGQIYLTKRRGWSENDVGGTVEHSRASLNNDPRKRYFEIRACRIES